MSDKKHTTETPDVSHISNPDVLHEESDIEVWAIAKFLIGLAIFTAISLGLVKGIEWFLESRAEAADARNAYPLALTGEERLPPEPRLQGAPGFKVTKQSTGETVYLDTLSRPEEPQAEWRELKKDYETILQKGYTDPNTHHQLIKPIDEATREFLADANQTKARTVESGKDNGAGGAEIPAQFSSGRMMEKRDQ